MRTSREVARYEDGEARLPGLTEADDRQRQLTRMGNAAGGAGLALLMDGRRDDAATWFPTPPSATARAFPRRPRAAGDVRSAPSRRACWPATGTGHARTPSGPRRPRARCGSPIGRYAASLALLVLGQDDEALVQAASIQGRDDFPADVADALAALALAMPTPTKRRSAPSCAPSRRARSTSRISASPTR